MVRVGNLSDTTSSYLKHSPVNSLRYPLRQDFWRVSFHEPLYIAFEAPHTKLVT